MSLRNPINPTQPNIIPANRIDATGQNVAEFLSPCQSAGLTNNYLANQNHVNDQDQFDIRVDHRFRDADQIFASYSFGDVRSQRPGPLGPLWGGSDCCPSISDSRAQHLGLGYTHTFSPRLLNDLHGGYFRYAVNALPFNFGKDLGVQLGIPNANRSTDPNSSGLTNIDIAGFTSLGDSEYLPEHAYENIFQVADTVAWMRGRHSLKFGIDFRRQQRNFYQVTAPRGFFDFGGVYTNDLTTANGGNGLADLLLGVPIANEQDFLLGLYPTRYWDLATIRTRRLPRAAESDHQSWASLRCSLTRQRTSRQLRSEPRDRCQLLWAESRFARRRAVRQERLGTALRVRLVACRGTQLCEVPSASSTRPRPISSTTWDSTHPTYFRGDITSTPGRCPSTAQLISSGFPATMPPGDSVNILGAVKTTGPRRTIPIIMEWNLNVQHQFAQNCDRSNRLRRYSGLPFVEP